MGLLSRWMACGVVALAALSGLAHASTVYTGTVTLSGADPTQLGRLSRNGLAQDWTGSEAFPGAINTGTSYHYQTVTLDMDALLAGMTPAPYLQISIDSLSANTFLSAYLDAYDPLNKASNWLGDAGSSGNAFGVNPLYFQVIVPTGHDLVLLLNETVTNGGLGAAANLLVEAFQDTDFTDPERLPARLPEPASLALALAALVPAMAVRRRKAATPRG